MAGFVPGFEYDVFVSYAHLDNRSTGWVETFENTLRNKLSEMIGENARVWRDPKLAGNDYFDAKIASAIAGSAVFVAVVSPRYVQSPSCRDEYRAFVQGKLPVRIRESSRIARVRKTPLPSDLAEPPELAADQTLGFPFFEQSDSGLLEYENDRELDSYDKFWNGVKTVAAALDKILRLVRSAQAPRERRQIVFLADTVKALAASRDELKRELIGRGHTVLPEQSLLVDGAFAHTAAQTAISSSSLSVHLLGASYGVIPEGSQQSLSHLEYLLAKEQQRPMLIWVPPELNNGAAPDSRLAELVAQVSKADAVSGTTHDVCETDFATFKEILLDAVVKDHAPVSTVTSCKSVYLLFHSDDIDSHELKSIRKHLLDAGYPVSPPVFEAADGELRDIEAQLILDNDATVIYYGSAKDSWVAQKRRFLLTALGSAQRGSQNRRALYLCPPNTKSKSFTFGDYKGGRDLPEARGFSPLFVVGDYESFSHDTLKPLLAWLEK